MAVGNPKPGLYDVRMTLIYGHGEFQLLPGASNNPPHPLKYINEILDLEKANQYNPGPDNVETSVLLQYSSEMS